MARKKSQEESIGEVLFDLFVDTAWWVPFPAAPILAGVALLLWYLLTVKLAHAAWDWNTARWIAIVAGAAVLLIGFAAQFKKSSRRKMVRDNQTLDSINKLSWREFERLVAAAYAQKGYAAKELGGSSPDGGKDVRLAGNGETVLVQCKHWKSRQVGVPVIREAYGVLMHEKVDRSVVVTAGTFTSEAIAFAQGKPIQLVDGRALVGLLAVAPSAQPSASVDGGPSTAPACPDCGSGMESRTARRGAHAGQRFWGCTRYPACKGIVNI